MSEVSVARLESAKKTYQIGTTQVGLWDATLEVSQGEFVAIVGPSGSGKSTTLNLLGLLDTAEAGSVTILGAEISNSTARERADLRASYISFVFQSFHLSDGRSVMDNVTDGLLFSVPRRERVDLASEALDHVGLSARQDQQVATLSGGERQRVAIARALAKEPALLLADEPTGNLDSANSRAILDLLRRSSDRGTSVVMVTHDRVLATLADRVIEVVDGRML